jgi:hypothetical protein
MPIIAELKQERDAAWAAINRNAAPTVENDWVKFALANAAWLKLYLKEFGKEPEPDRIDVESTNYYQQFCRKQAQVREQTVTKSDETRGKTNQYRRDHKTSLVQ